jgi:hypothetical protein
LGEPGALNGAGTRNVGTLGEAAAAVSPDREIHLALPCDAALLARLRFPATDRAELGGMVRLQLEKTLPYAAEEITSDFDIIESNGHESVLLAAAVSTARLNALCQPLRDFSRLPSKVTLFVMHVAALCPKDKTVFLVYMEGGKIVAAVCEKAKPVCVQTMAGASAVMSALPQFLMSAELQGVPTDFSLVRLDRACGELEVPLREFFGTPVELFSTDSPAPPAPRTDLLPASWRKERQRLTRTARVKQRLLLAGAIYASLFILAGLYLAATAARVHALDRKLEAMRPQTVYIQARQNRWNALAPAIDPARFTVELLYQINNCLPSESVRLTSFQQIGSELAVESEAPTAAMAIRFGVLLKSNDALSRYGLDITAPRILPNEHAQIRIAGKL